MLAELFAACRRLRRTPAWSVAVVLTLAVAIGANLAVFARVEAAVWRELPYPDPDRLVLLWEGQPEKGRDRFGVSAPMAREWRSDVPALAAVTAYFETEANFAGGAQPERVRVAQTTSGLLPTLGVQALLGRGFLPEDEDGPGAVCLLAHDFWKSAFAGDPLVLGRQVRLGNESLTVVGVLPAEVGEPFDDPAIFRPLSLAGNESRGMRWLQVVARLAPELSPPTAAAELAALAHRLEESSPATNRGWRAQLALLAEVVAERPRATLVPIALAVALVLLLAGANVASLFVVRTLGRRRETAIRHALGGGGWELARPVVTEATVVGVAGGALGLALAWAGDRAIARTEGGLAIATPGSLLTPRTLLCALLLALGSAALVALLSVLSGRNVAGPSGAALLRASGADTGRSNRRRVRRGLVVVEIAGAFVLLVGAGLLARSVGRLLAVEPGFELEGVLTARVAPVQAALPEDLPEAELLELYAADRAHAAGFYERLSERLATRPEVRAIGAINRLPMTGNWWVMNWEIAGTAPAPGEERTAFGRVVTPGYFAAIGARRVAGREFDAGDRADSAPVVIVDRTLAHEAFGDADPLGRSLTLDGRRTATIVGVVGEARLSGLDRPAPATYYVPMTQAEFGFYPDWGMDLVVATTGDPLAAVPLLREEIRALDPALPLFSIRTLDSVLERTLGARTSVLRLLGSFSALALALAAIGLYGILAQLGRERLREYGVRLALGARAVQLASGVVGEGLGLAAAGSALGALASLGVARLLGRLLYGVGAADPLTFAASALLLAATTVAAALPTAWRAMRTDPTRSLREL